MRAVPSVVVRNAPRRSGSCDLTRRGIFDGIPSCPSPTPPCAFAFAAVGLQGQRKPRLLVIYIVFTAVVSVLVSPPLR